MVSTYPDLRVRIVAVLLSCGVALIAALAYNLGGIAISDKLARRMMEDEKNLRSRQRQLQTCQKTLRALNDDSDKEAVLKTLAEEEDAVVAHNTLLEKMIAEHKHDTRECRRELDTALHDRSAATLYEENPQHVLKRLLHESSQLEVSLGDANDTTDTYQKTLLTQVRALRLETSHLRNRLISRKARVGRQQQAEAAAHKEQDRHEHTDTGLGQAGTGRDDDDAAAATFGVPRIRTPLKNLEDSLRRLASNSPSLAGVQEGFDPEEAAAAAAAASASQQRLLRTKGPPPSRAPRSSPSPPSPPPPQVKTPAGKRREGLSEGSGEEGLSEAKKKKKTTKTTSKTKEEAEEGAEDTGASSPPSAKKRRGSQQHYRSRSAEEREERTAEDEDESRERRRRQRRRKSRQDRSSDNE
eukprot:Rhum_TRINITY_DN15332_c1_g1::Rhum_TRINITY_DN15332_c1_g1_i1::g.151776::m.151776